MSEQESAADSAALLFATNNQPTVIFTNWPAYSTQDVYTAVSGLYPVLINGINISSNYLGSSDDVHDVQPRTAFGISQDRRHLYLN